MYEFYKKCDESLKNTLIKLYGQYMNEDKLNAFKNKDYITDEVMGIKRLNDVFDYILNNMLNDLLNVICNTKTQIDEETDLSIPCGITLKNALKSYYKLAISRKISFTPRINYEYAFDIDTINYLNEYFDNVVDKNVFNKNALELLEVEELNGYVDLTISNDLQDYLQKENLL